MLSFQQSTAPIRNESLLTIQHKPIIYQAKLFVKSQTDVLIYKSCVWVFFFLFTVISRNNQNADITTLRKCRSGGDSTMNARVPLIWTDADYSDLRFTETRLRCLELKRNGYLLHVLYDIHAIEGLERTWTLNAVPKKRQAVGKGLVNIIVCVISLRPLLTWFCSVSLCGGVNEKGKEVPASA